MDASDRFLLCVGKAWRVVFLCLVFCMAIQSAHAQHTVMSWNVENLFDCTHDSLKEDHAFLPDGDHQWTHFRYWKKLVRIARTIASVYPELGWPVLVGLQEVENDSVMRDLTRRTPLRKVGYSYVMTQSPDERGIDVALMYRSDVFRLLDSRSVRVSSQANGLRPTRDILLVSGVLPSDDTLHVAVVHLSSRAGDSRAGSRNRQLAAESLRAVADSLKGKRLLVMGDFNAEESDPIFRVLCPPLHTLMHKVSRKNPVGTYFFQGRWNILDHMLVSPALLPQMSYGAHPLALPFLLNEQGTPHRTYLGTYYGNGISDHLPVVSFLLPDASR